MSIDNTDDVIDSRDVIARIEELTLARADLLSDDALDAEHVAINVAGWDEANATELGALSALAEQAEGYAEDWAHGVALIRDSYFKDYAQELADDCGEPAPTSWPYTCIDWDQAARELQMDYTSVDFAGVTYWVR